MRSAAASASRRRVRSIQPRLASRKRHAAAREPRCGIVSTTLPSGLTSTRGLRARRLTRSVTNSPDVVAAPVKPVTQAALSTGLLTVAVEKISRHHERARICHSDE
jgi:hypothetical protein